MDICKYIVSVAEILCILASAGLVFTMLHMIKRVDREKARKIEERQRKKRARKRGIKYESTTKRDNSVYRRKYYT